MKYAAESILSSDGDVIQSVWVDDRLGELATWDCSTQGAVCSVVVVEPSNSRRAGRRWIWFTMRVRSSSSVRQVRIQRSMIAFMRGTRIPVMIVAMPLSARTTSKDAVYLLSRPRIRYFTVAWASCRSMTRFLAIWVVQAAVGCAVAPRMRMRRVAWSMTAKT